MSEHISIHAQSHDQSAVSAEDPSRDVQDPDGEVVARIADGNLRADLDELMRRHGSEILRYCSAELNDASLAEEVHQQVFVEAFRNLAGFRGRSSLRTWLFSIARHRVLDALKTRRRAHNQIQPLESPEGILNIQDPSPSAEACIDDHRLRLVLMECLQNLDENSRTAILLRFNCGMTFEDMATVCSEKPGTLHARVARALPRLRAMIEARVTTIPVNQRSLGGQSPGRPCTRDFPVRPLPGRSA